MLIAEFYAFEWIYYKKIRLAQCIDTLNNLFKTVLHILGNMFTESYYTYIHEHSTMFQKNRENNIVDHSCRLQSSLL